MRKKDLPVIIVIVVISAVISLLVSKAIFAPPKNRQQQVDVVQTVTTDFPSADTHYFNKNSIDPTQLITIGQNTNTNPFSAPTSQ
jgi:uncharacterized protein YpmB